jgi:hypothetical protein
VASKQGYAAPCIRTPEKYHHANFREVKFAFWVLCEVPTIPQPSIALPYLPGLSFAGLREEQESERFRVVRTRSRCRTRTNAVSGSVDARLVENERPRKGEAEDLTSPLTRRSVL